VLKFIFLEQIANLIAEHLTTLKKVMVASFMEENTQVEEGNFQGI
jgi:hypothetical protein